MTRKAWLTLVVLTVGFGPGVVRTRAQDQLREFTRPILVLNTGGHHAPIRSLIFTPDGVQLLTAGLDKVVNVWSVQGAKPALEATIRPPIWRGPAGEIHALALAPAVDERGKRVLAVAGFGIGNRRGNIGLFYLPVSGAIGTGEHFAELVRDDANDGNAPNDPRASGHADTVTSLKFDATGTYLASGSVDGTARIWDWRNRKSTAILTGHAGAINAIAFTQDGAHLVTGGRDGTLRLWDINRPDAPIATATYPPRYPNDPLCVQINTLAVSDDGQWVVIGREDGRVLRYDATTLGNQALLVPGGEIIEAVALSHDSKRLVTSSIRRLDTAGELPRLTCSIRIRRLPDGASLRELPPFDSIAYACGFSPDDKILAVAGGDMQTIRLFTNWDTPQPAIVSVQGQGRSIWDVGLRMDDGRLTVGYSHDPNDNLILAARGPVVAPRGPLVRPRYIGMILPSRERRSYDPTELSRGLIEYAGWTVRPVSPFQLDVVHATPPQRSFRITLDEVKDRRWKSYSFIPPGPEHAEPTVAVGCESGVWFHRLDNGRPTRLYSGHSGSVYCLAPAKDGRWLATGSSDQTVRLWTLANCDKPPTLGAEFERGPDGIRVTAVEPLGFADAMGLRKGDIPVKFALARKEVDANDFLAHYEEQLPNSPIELIVRRRVEPPPGQGQGPAPGVPAAAEEQVALYTSRRNGPAVSLFMAEDREWVLWMPSGYYDTSIAGDTKFLGWHMNRGTLFQPKPSDYLEIIKFENQLRQPRRSQPNKLDTLLTTAELAAAIAVPFPRPLRMDPVPPRPVDPRLNVRPPAVAAAGAQAPARGALPALAMQSAPATVPAGAAPAAPGDRAPALGASSPPPATPAPDAGVAVVPAPVPPAPPAQPLARADASSTRLIPRPGAPTASEVKPPVAPPLAGAGRVPTPSPASTPTAPPATTTPLVAVAAPAAPQPEPGPAAPAVADARSPTAAIPDRPIQPRRPQPAPLEINPPRAQPLGPIASATPAPAAPGGSPRTPVQSPAARTPAAGTAAPPPAAPALEAGGAPVPAPERLANPPIQQVARAETDSTRLVPRPAVSAVPGLKPAAAEPLRGVVQIPTPQPASPPTAQPRVATPSLAVEKPNPPQPEPGRAGAAAAPVAVAGAPNPAPAIPERPIQPGRPQPAPLGITPPRTQPLGQALASIPAPPLVPVRPPAVAPGQAIARPAPLAAQPLEPVEFVELAAPPLLEPRIQLLPNQRITTLEGKPIDPREVVPDKIAIGDLDADGKGTLLFDMTIDAEGRSPAQSFDYLVDGHPIQPATIFDQPIALRHEAVRLSLAPGPHRFTAQVANAQGIKRTISRDIFVRGLPQHRPTRLKLLTIAPTYQQTRIPAIEFAERDARDLRDLFQRHLVSPEDEKPLYSIDEERLEGPSATAARVKKAIDALKDESLGEGDLVVVVIESHFIHVGSERSLVAADGMNIPPTPGIPADELARNLGGLALHGCKVIVLLDGVHTASSKVWDTDVTDWVRNLRDEQNVITFVASNSGPSKSLPTQGHRAFAQAVLDAVKPPLIKESAYLLNDFRDVVIEKVLKLTERQQQAACYLPESINGQFPILNPQATGR